MEQNRMVVIHSFPIWLPQTQTWMYTQAAHLPKSIEVHVVCERTENLEQFAVSNLHSLKNESMLDYCLETTLRKIKKRRFKSYLADIAGSVDANLIHSHFGHIGWDDVLTARRMAVGHVVTFYGADVKKLPKQDRRWLGRYHELFSSADLFLCEGPHMAAELTQLGCPKEKIKVHHLGVDLQKFQFKPRQWDGDTPLQVLIVAGFKEKKGIPFALRALARLQSFVPLMVTIIGDASFQPDDLTEKRRILQTLDDTDLRAKTRLLGFQPYSVILREAYNHHIFLSPSVTAANGDTEGGAPVTLIEMMATGIPVVSTKHCDIPEVVKYGDDDWLAAERDIEGLVDRLRWLVENSKHWETRLAAGREHIQAEFDAVRQGRKLEKIYQSMSAGHHAA